MPVVKDGITYKYDPDLDARYHPFKGKTFFLNNMLHRAVRVEKSRDIIYAWCFRDHRVKPYLWSETQKKKERAFRSGEVADLLGRSYWTVYKYVKDGDIAEGNGLEMSYGLYFDASGGNIKETGNRGIRYWSESKVMELRDHLADVHRGRPRHDGYITSRVPSRHELRLKMREDDMIYKKDKNGNFVPVWRAYE